MKALIINELKSNLFRFFNKNYEYNHLMKRSYDEGFPIIFSVFLLNILFLLLAFATDFIDIFLEIPYWWSLLVKLPIVLFSVVNFKVWEDKKLCILELITIGLSIFFPYYTIFAFLYILIQACIKFSFITSKKGR